MDKRIKNAVNGRLQAKGYQENGSQPDFLLAYHTNVKEKFEYRIGVMLMDRAVVSGAVTLRSPNTTRALWFSISWTPGTSN